MMMLMSGEHIWKTNRPCALFLAKTDRCYFRLPHFFCLRPPAGCFRQMPPSSARCGFGSLLVLVSYGGLSHARATKSGEHMWKRNRGSAELQEK